ncbi:MAG: roadblock/LC7 domain-containing protein [Chloroflexi bacterium]|nr:roadblock/LC7 domain-containing protein [Chloroflexota bacterium]
MPDSKEPIKAILHDILRASPHITAAAVVHLSGLIVVSVMPYYVEEERVSAMSAVMLLLGERLTGAMKNGQLNKVYVRGETGHTVITAIGEEAVLSINASDEVPLGLLFIEMELAAEKLRELV